MVEFVTVVVSRSELAALELAKKIGFGELRYVDIHPGAESEEQLSEQQRRFIEATRNCECAVFDKITVQNGVPVFLEVSGKHNGISYLRKVKI